MLYNFVGFTWKICCMQSSKVIIDKPCTLKDIWEGREWGLNSKAHRFSAGGAPQTIFRRRKKRGSQGTSVDEQLADLPSWCEANTLTPKSRRTLTFRLHSTLICKFSFRFRKKEQTQQVSNPQKTSSVGHHSELSAPLVPSFSVPVFEDQVSGPWQRRPKSCNHTWSTPKVNKDSVLQSIHSWAILLEVQSCSSILLVLQHTTRLRASLPLSPQVERWTCPSIQVEWLYYGGDWQWLVRGYAQINRL